MSGQKHRLAENGFALVAVLWGVALLALIATSVLSSSSLSYWLGRNDGARAEALALAEAGSNRAILGIIDSRQDKRWRVDGAPIGIKFGGTTVRVRIQDQSGLIDLNAADDSTLTSLFMSTGLASDVAKALTDKILDWREPGETRRPNGAKSADYRAKGYAYGPRNGPFQSVDEVRLVMDVSRELFERIRPALTVYTRRPYVDPQFAPKQVLLALPSMTPEQVDNILMARAAVPDNGALPSGVIDPALPLAGRAFAIHADVAASRGGTVSRDAVIRFTDDARRPYWILWWQ